MVSFYTSFGNIFAVNLSLIRPIEPVIDDNRSQIHGLVPPNFHSGANIEVGGVRGHLEA